MILKSMQPLPMPRVPSGRRVALMLEWLLLDTSSFCVMKWEKKPEAQKPPYYRRKKKKMLMRQIWAARRDETKLSKARMERHTDVPQMEIWSFVVGFSGNL